MELSHRIKIFLYRQQGPEPSYLLLKPDQGIEALWGPLHGELGFGDKLEGAVRRKVMSDTGIAKPGQLIDLEMPGRFTLGDEEIIEWTYGYQSLADLDRERMTQHWADFRWLEFTDAYPSLGFEADRGALMRLHAKLRVA
ncbi:MAG: hypothetical protein ACI835_004671 [Planctomycetota bacterium]|jgi:hypothetical protein